MRIVLKDIHVLSKFTPVLWKSIMISQGLIPTILESALGVSGAFLVSFADYYSVVAYRFSTDFLLDLRVFLKGTCSNSFRCFSCTLFFYARTSCQDWGHFIMASLNRVLLIYISRLRFSLPDLSTLCKSAMPTKPNELLVESSKGALVSVVRRGW